MLSRRSFLGCAGASLELCVDRKILIRRFFPAKILSHSIQEDLLPFVMIPLPAGESAVECPVDPACVKKIKGKAVSLLRGLIGCVDVKDCVGEASGASCDRDRPIAEGDELCEAAWFKA